MRRARRPPGPGGATADASATWTGSGWSWDSSRGGCDAGAGSHRGRNLARRAPGRRIECSVVGLAVPRDPKLTAAAQKRLERRRGVYRDSKVLSQSRSADLDLSMGPRFASHIVAAVRLEHAPYRAWAGCLGIRLERGPMSTDPRCDFLGSPFVVDRLGPVTGPKKNQGSVPKRGHSPMVRNRCAKASRAKSTPVAIR